jgi:hypothetical protein
LATNFNSRGWFMIECFELLRDALT